MNLFETMERMLAEGIDPTTRSEEIWRQFSRRYAALVIDSSGFTRTVERHGPIHYLARIARMRTLALPVLQRHHARIPRFEADNILACFDEVDQAVGAAMGIHEAIVGSGLLLTEDEPFRICTGIGYGDLLYSETLEGCFGHEMNLASKLGEDIAEPDQLLLTRAAYDACNHDLKRGMVIADAAVSGTTVDYFQVTLER